MFREAASFSKTQLALHLSVNGCRRGSWFLFNKGKQIELFDHHCCFVDRELRKRMEQAGRVVNGLDL
jgi:hypothetical protein